MGAAPQAGARPRPTRQRLLLDRWVPAGLLRAVLQGKVSRILATRLGPLACLPAACLQAFTGYAAPAAPAYAPPAAPAYGAPPPVQTAVSRAAGRGSAGLAVCPGVVPCRLGCHPTTVLRLIKLAALLIHCRAFAGLPSFCRATTLMPRQPRPHQHTATVLPPPAPMPRSPPAMPPMARHRRARRRRPPTERRRPTAPRLQLHQRTRREATKAMGTDLGGGGRALLVRCRWLVVQPQLLLGAVASVALVFHNVIWHGSTTPSCRTPCKASLLKFPMPGMRGWCRLAGRFGFARGLRQL